MTAADRQRRFRARRRWGLIALPGLDIPDDFTSTLVEAGFLKQKDTENRNAIRKAVEKFIVHLQKKATAEQKP